MKWYLRLSFLIQLLCATKVLRNTSRPTALFIPFCFYFYLFIRSANKRNNFMTSRRVQNILFASPSLPKKKGEAEKSWKSWINRKQIFGIAKGNLNVFGMFRRALSVWSSSGAVGFTPTQMVQMSKAKSSEAIFDFFLIWTFSKEDIFL